MCAYILVLFIDYLFKNICLLLFTQILFVSDKKALCCVYVSVFDSYSLTGLYQVQSYLTITTITENVFIRLC